MDASAASSVMAGLVLAIDALTPPPRRQSLRTSTAWTYLWAVTSARRRQAASRLLRLASALGTTNCCPGATTPIRSSLWLSMAFVDKSRHESRLCAARPMDSLKPEPRRAVCLDGEHGSGAPPNCVDALALVLPPERPRFQLRLRTSYYRRAWMAGTSPAVTSTATDRGGVPRLARILSPVPLTSRSGAWPK